jgi:hypothetical protein
MAEPVAVVDPRDLAWQQLAIAEAWVGRAEAFPDVFYQFVSYFTAFNAVYFFWRRYDEMTSGKVQASEKAHIEIAVRQHSAEEAGNLLGACERNVQFFIHRGGVRRMEARTIAEPWMGSETEGCTYVATLEAKETSDLDKLVALAKLVYLVRCNLVHGGKRDSGNDETVTINGLSVLLQLVPSLIELTKVKAEV